MNEIKPMIQEGLSHEVVVFEKQGGFAVLALTCHRDGSVVQIGRTDPRMSPPSWHSDQESVEAGRRRFKNSIRTSIERGWRVAWRGFPYG